MNAIKIAGRNCIFYRWEFIENLLKFNPIIRELNYKINWQILA